MLPRVDLIRTQEFSYLLMNSPDHISNFIKQQGFWGELESTLGKALTSDMPSPIIIDAGANLGGFALPMAKHIHNTGGTVHSFEPQRIVFQQLCSNIFLNQLDNVHTYNVALGNQNTFIKIPELNFNNSQNVGRFSVDADIRQHIDNDIQAGSTYSPNQEVEHALFNVRQITLDSLEFKQNVAFLKVDVEGYELDFFQGAINTLQQNNFPPLIFEVWDKSWYADKAEKTNQFLASMGYQFKKFGRDTLAQHPAFHRYLEFSENAGNINITLKFRA